MSNKLNIFNSLPQYPSDDEEEVQQVQTQKKGKQQQGGRAQGSFSPHQSITNPSVENKQAPKATTTTETEQKPKENKAKKQSKPAKKEATAEETTEAPVVEEKPTLTLQEYYEQQRFAQEDQEVNEAKAKITSDQLLKELGKATALKSKNQEKNDDHRVGKKKGHLDVDHHAGLATEHANLLGNHPDLRNIVFTIINRFQNWFH